MNFNQSSTEQAFSSDFVINPDSIDPDFPAIHGYPGVGDMNTGKKKKQTHSCSGGKTGKRSLQKRMFEHLNAEFNPQL